jgi:hypothetical protein
MVVLLLALGAGVAWASLGGAPRQGAVGDVALQKGLVGWWKFDGGLKDATPGSHNDSYAGTTTYGVDRKGVGGKALALDGTTNFGTVSDFDYHVMRQGYESASWTMSVWAKASGANTSETLLVGRDGCHGGIYTWSGGYAFAIKTNACWTGAQAITYTPAEMTDWHLLTGVYAGGAMTFYVDGVSVGTATFTSTFDAYTTTLRLGGSGSSGWFYNGSMDDVRVYDRALSGPEVTALYNTSNSGTTVSGGGKGMVGWWKFDGNARDSSPRGNNGAVNGAALVADRKGRADSAYTLGNSAQWINGLAGGLEWREWHDVVGLLMRTGASTYQWPEIMGAANTHTYYGIRSTSFGDSIVFEYGTSPYAGTFASTASHSLPTNEWHMVTFTYDGSTLRYYWDGSLFQTVSSVTLNPTFGGMAFTTSSNGWQGSIDDARAYNYALGSTDVAAIYGSYGSQVSMSSLQKGLVGDWPMNGTIRDLTPQSNNGTIGGNVLPTTDRKGRANSAYVMDGANGEQITLSSTGAYTQFGTNSFSVTAWVKTSEALNQRCIMSTAGEGRGWRFGYGSGRPYYLVGDGANYQEGTIGTATLNDNAWHALAIVYSYDANWSVTAYIDGVSTGTVSLPGTIGSASNSFATIGSMNGGTGGVVTGSIDDVRGMAWD